MGYKHSVRTIFILGVPRSGTSWLGKIFDSHPDTLFRHEPDIINRNKTLPFLCDPDRASSYVANAQAWLNELAKIAVAKTAGSQPVFGKSYHTSAQTAARRLIIAALRAAGQLPGIARIAQSVPIPDFIDLESGQFSHLVIKSVSCMGRGRILAEAAPDSHFILIVRHPCGEVASMIRGVKERRFETEVPILALAQMTQARRRGLTTERLRRLPLFAQLAWSWALLNEKALEDLTGTKHLTILRYEDLAENPNDTAKRLFEFCGINWCRSTSAFIAASCRATGREGYYELRRNPIEAASKWRRDWSQSEVDAIFEIASQTVPGRLFLTTNKHNRTAGAS